MADFETTASLSESEALFGKSSTGDDTPPVHRPIGLSPSARSRLSSLGILNFVVLSVGSLITLGTLALLCCLWPYLPGIWHSELSPPPLWNSIILSGWLSRTITLSSAVLRSIAAVQATVCMSVVASLALERSRVPVKFVPLMLAVRGIGTNPHVLVQFCLQSFRDKSTRLYAMIMTLLMATTFLSQLTSTFLIGDLQVTLVLNNTVSESIGIGFAPVEGASRNDVDRGVEYWKSRIPEYPVFAQYAEAPTSASEWANDTGTTLRAFLPLKNSAARRHLSNYDGFATLLDTRFTCLLPTVDANLTVDDSSRRYLDGQIELELPDHMHAHNNSKFSRHFTTSFNCSFAAPEPSTDPQAAFEWAITVCQLPVSGLFTPSPLLNSDNMDQPVRGFIILNTTAFGESWEMQWRTGGDMTGNHNGPWMQFSQSTPASAPDHSISVSISVCLSPLYAVDVPLRVSGSPGREEPTLLWKEKSSTYDVTGIRKLHAGARDALTPEERGVLSIESQANWTMKRANTTAIATISNPMLSVAGASTSGFWPAATLCTYCENGFEEETIRVHRVLVYIFQDIIKSTGSLPLAMQALWTLLGQAAYYDFLPEFDVKESANMTLFTPVSAPAKLYGIGIVLAVAVIQTLAVLIVTCLFLAEKLLSSPGNLWQAFGQMNSGDLREVVSLSSAALDKEVKLYLQEHGEDKAEAKLVYNSGAQLLVSCEEGRIIRETIKRD